MTKREKNEMRERLKTLFEETLSGFGIIPAIGDADSIVDAVLDELARPTPAMLAAICSEVWRVDPIQAGFIAAIEHVRGRK